VERRRSIGAEESDSGTVHFLCLCMTVLLYRDPMDFWPKNEGLAISLVAFPGKKRKGK
jgi:hypothetical protein